MLSSEPLPERVFTNQGLQFANYGVVIAAQEVGVDARLDGYQSKLIQARDFACQDRDVVQSSVRAAESFAERCGENGASRHGILGHEMAAFFHRRFKSKYIERARIGVHPVAVSLADDGIGPYPRRRP